MDEQKGWTQEREAEAFSKQMLNPLSARLTRRTSVAAARSSSRGMKTCSYVDLESGRFAILGLLPLVAVLLAEWDPAVAKHYFGHEDPTDETSSSEDQAFGSLSPLIKEYRDNRVVWLICADDNNLGPSKSRVLKIKNAAAQQGAEIELFNADKFRAKAQRFRNCVLLNCLSQKAPLGRFNFFPEESAIRKLCAKNRNTCLLELQQIPALDIAKVQAVTARMIRCGLLALEGKGDPLNQKPFTLVTPLKWQDEQPRLQLVKNT